MDRKKLLEALWAKKVLTGCPCGNLGTVFKLHRVRFFHPKGCPKGISPESDVLKLTTIRNFGWKPIYAVRAEDGTYYPAKGYSRGFRIVSIEEISGLIFSEEEFTQLNSSRSS